MNNFAYVLSEIYNRIVIDTNSRLIELQDRIYRIFTGLKDTNIGTALKLSNGLIVITTYENIYNNNRIVLIHFCELNKKDKKLKMINTIKTDYQLIIDICQINPNMVMAYDGNTYGAKRTLKFYHIESKLLITEVIQSVDIVRLYTYPRMFGNDLLLVGNKNKVDIFNINNLFTKLSKLVINML